ncbi:MAG: glycoside hydrolase family 16 protein [Chitinophagaceae bacterium]
MKPLLCVCAIICIFILQACTAKDKASMVSGGEQTRKLVWAEEFNYTGLPDSSKWSYENGFVRNGEPQYYTVKRLENCHVENGMLVIEARKETWPNAAYKAGSTNASQKDSLAAYTSASINTLGKQTWQYGRIEVRAKLPAGKGSWPAIWMMGENRAQIGWPGCGEIDIMEFLGKDPTTVYATMHYPDTTASGNSSLGGKYITTNIADSFHVYAIEWDSNQISFYFDDKKYFVFDIKNSQHTSFNPFQKKCYLLLNLALGKQGSWPGPTDDAILPFRYYVDYVRVYQ